MLSRLLPSCGLLWLFGLFEMSVARFGFALDTDAFAFELGAWAWIVGGASYAVLGAISFGLQSASGVASDSVGQRPTRTPASARVESSILRGA